MNKTEIQARIEKVESELASLKADLAKCDCAEGIEQEMCWYACGESANLYTSIGRTKSAVSEAYKLRPAYMPECRQVTADDVARLPSRTVCTNKEIAALAHSLGFRMKVTP